MMSRHTKRLLAAAAVVLAVGCSDEREPVAPSDQPDLLTRPAAQGTVDNPNALAKGVAGFGGFFYDAAGTPTVYLKDSKERGNTERALAPYFQKHGVAAARMQVRPGKFSWDELERWQASVSTQTLGLPGAVFVDADEASNQVTIGVEHGKGGQVRAALARLGLPASAAVVRETDPITFAVAPKPKPTTLQGLVRPIHGGTQINFPGFLCTLGFSANDGSQRSFITNSHCTNVQGGVNNTPYWQPLQSTAPTQIATEVEDPTYGTNLPGCPSGRVCRRPTPRARSTAARARRRARSPSARSRRRDRPGRNLTITGEFSITAEDEAVQGQTVNKVGRTTGWSQGAVTGVCVNTSC